MSEHYLTSEIAEAFGVSRQRIHQIMKVIGLPRRKSGYTYDEVLKVAEYRAHDHRPDRYLKAQKDTKGMSRREKALTLWKESHEVPEGYKPVDGWVYKGKPMIMFYSEAGLLPWSVDYDETLNHYETEDQAREFIERTTRSGYKKEYMREYMRQYHKRKKAKK